MIFRLTLLILLVPLLNAPAHAGIIFGRKKDKVDPKQRVPELVGTLKNDKDADRRATAAFELRYFDPGAFPEIVPALIEALQNDGKSGVRIDAANSLSKLRPVSQQVGDALEQAVSKDASMRVRLQARSALLQYHWAGYRGKKGDVPSVNPTREPPLLDDKSPPPISTTKPLTDEPSPIPPPVKPSPSNEPKIRPVPSTPQTPKGKSPLNDLPPVPNPKTDPVKPKEKGLLDDLPAEPAKADPTPKVPTVESGPDLP